MAVVALGIILFLLAVGTALLFFLNRSDQQKIDAATSVNADLQTQLTQKQATLTDAKTFQAQLENLQVLVNNHTYLSPLLEELSKSTYSKTQFVNLDASQSGKIHLEGRVDNYSDLGKLLLGLSTSKKFKNVKLLSAAPSTGKTNGFLYSVDMLVVPDIFIKK